MDRNKNVPIAFFDLLTDQSWEPLEFAADDPSFYWKNDQEFMTSAPVDIAATFKGAMWSSPDVEPAFKWRGRRVQPGFVIPKRHHNLAQIMVVVEGQMNVQSGGQSLTVGKGEFWTIEPETPYTLTAGPEGVTYLESWTEPLQLVETYWHDDENWKRV